MVPQRGWSFRFLRLATSAGAGFPVSMTSIIRYLPVARLVLAALDARGLGGLDGPAPINPTADAGTRENGTASTETKARADPHGYPPPPESEGGWRRLEKPGDIRSLAGLDPDKLADLKQWLLDSDNRDFAA